VYGQEDPSASIPAPLEPRFDLFKKIKREKEERLFGRRLASQHEHIFRLDWPFVEDSVRARWS
jgi:hypothetical protein